MTIKECIDIVDNLKPNQYTIKDKVMWLSFIEEIIINEVLKTHEGYDGRHDLFEGYSEDNLSVALIVPSPYDRLYTAYLKMKIDEENGETARYNNSMVMYNTYMSEYRKHYNKTHMPLTQGRRIPMHTPKRVSVGLTEAEYENLKRDMTAILTEYFADTVSEDKMYGIVTRFVQDNAQMLRGKDGKDGADGKDGYTPIKGIDYTDGAKGPKGDKGEPGEKGEKGDRGYQGAKGDKGNQGEKGDKGADGYTPKKGIDYFTAEEIEAMLKPLTDKIASLTKKALVKTVTISLPSSSWDEIGDNQYSQIVNIDGVTEYSKVDLQPALEQLAIFHEKDVTFVTENDGGIITVYCIGQKPTNDYTMQATITEVE